MRADLNVIAQWVAPQARVLDLGCGVGRHLVYLSSQGFEMHGLDLSPAGVERCQKELLRN